MRLNQLSTEKQVDAIRSHSQRALKFDALDHCANLARSRGVWKQCASVIHERNMTILGKVRQGYPPAVWKKGFHEVIVVNEHVTIKGKEIHVRQLCKRGYKFIPVRRI